MARKPKANRLKESSAALAEEELPEVTAEPEPEPAPVRRGRQPKPAAAASEPVVADAEPSEAPAQKRRGPKPKSGAGAKAKSAVSEAKPARVPRGRKSSPAEPAAEPTAAAPAPEAAVATKSAAQWDRASDTARFDWTEIERIASQEGPNQGMAKLLIAARAEGANSRWPL